MADDPYDGQRYRIDLRPREPLLLQGLPERIRALPGDAVPVCRGDTVFVASGLP